jgi:hypothetical protein
MSATIAYIMGVSRPCFGQSLLIYSSKPNVTLADCSRNHVTFVFPTPKVYFLSELGKKDSARKLRTALTQPCLYI